MMHSKGLTKLLEECGELSQVAAKRSAYPEGPHPDEHRERPLNERMEDEMADVSAAMEFVAMKHGLDVLRIYDRRTRKLALFQQWDHEE